MRQAELHLELGPSAAVRGPLCGETASGMASGFLHRGRQEARTGSAERFENKGRDSMEKNPATVAFVVPGVPVGKGRPRFARRGNFVSTYTDSKTASYENLVKVKAEQAMIGRALFEGAVYIHIALFITPPESWSQKKKNAALAGDIYPTVKPDWDNCGKGICDAINEIVFKDDKQVVDAHVIKRYAETARAVVEVTAI